MAKFYAHIQGSRGPASRLGCLASGIRASIKSWEGEVNVNMWHSAPDKCDWVWVTLERHGGSASGERVTLYRGPCDGWRTHQDAGELARQAWRLEHLVKEYA